MEWVYDPNSGGIKIPKKVQELTKSRILTYTEENYSGKYNRIDIKFRGQFCYIDDFVEPFIPPDFPPPDFPESQKEYIERVSNNPINLGRLRYFDDEDSWSYAFYKYSDMKYELYVLDDGDYYGTPEEGFKAGAVYLQKKKLVE